MKKLTFFVVAKNREGNLMGLSNCEMNWWQNSIGMGLSVAITTRDLK